MLVGWKREDVNVSPPLKSLLLGNSFGEIRMLVACNKRNITNIKISYLQKFTADFPVWNGGLLPKGTTSVKNHSCKVDKSQFYGSSSLTNWVAKLRISLNPLVRFIIFLLKWQSLGTKWCVASGKLTHNYGKIHHFSWENSLFLWPCSIAFCMFTRPGRVVSTFRSFRRRKKSGSPTARFAQRGTLRSCPCSVACSPSTP